MCLSRDIYLGSLCGLPLMYPKTWYSLKCPAMPRHRGDIIPNKRRGSPYHVKYNQSPTPCILTPYYQEMGIAKKQPLLSMQKNERKEKKLEIDTLLIVTYPFITTQKIT